MIGLKDASTSKDREIRPARTGSIFSNVSIRAKLAVLFVGMSFLAFGLGGSLVSRWAEEALENEILARLALQCRAAANAINSEFGLFARRSEDFASDGLIRGHTAEIQDSSDPKTTARLSSELRQHLLVNKLPLVPGFLNLAVTGRTGTFLVSAKEEPTLRAARSFPPSSPQDQTWISGFAISDGGEGEHEPNLVISTPLREFDSNQICGRLHVLVRAQDWMAAASAAIGNTEEQADVDLEFVLRDPSGAQLVSTLGPGRLAAAPRLREGQPARAESGPLYSPLLGQFSRSYRLSADGWWVEIGLDASRVLAPILDLRNRLLGVGILLAALSLLLLYFPMRFIAMPIARLKSAANRLREGRLDTRVEVNSEDEIGQLGMAFNSMAESIGERTHRLETVAAELRERQAELRAGRDRLQTVISSMQDGMVVLDEQGKVLISNAAARPLLDFIDRGAKATGHHLCRDEEAPKGGCFDCLLHVTSATRSCIVDVEGRTFEVHTTPLSVEPGGGRGRVFVAHEVTDRIQRDEREIHNERLAVLGEVAAVMAHEINNPLASISMFNQMLAAELPPDSPLRENTEVIARNTDSAKRTIRELLNYATGASPEVGSIDIHDTLDDVSRFLRPLSERAGVSLRTAKGAARPQVTGDEVQIRQVFVNLALNAIQAVASRSSGLAASEEPKSGITSEVVLSTRDDGDHLIIDVADTGPGIPSENRERIFRPFFTTKSRGEGTGLGLPTSRRIAEMHGGSLNLVETSPAGTVFRVRLRARHAVEAAPR